jgi:2-oxoisovalerate dehydrogenase E1 component beta subunit
VFVAEEAAKVLEKEGISLEIIDLRTVAPLDEQAIENTVKKTNRVIVLHEDNKTGGIAGEIAAIINERAFDHLDAPITRITALDMPAPFSPPLEKVFLPKVEDVVREARRLMKY